MKDKTIRITAKQALELKAGNFKAFALNMIKVGQSIGEDGYFVESMQGPYYDQENNEEILIITLQRIP